MTPLVPSRRPADKRCLVVAAEDSRSGPILNWLRERGFLAEWTLSLDDAADLCRRSPFSLIMIDHAVETHLSLLSFFESLPDADGELQIIPINLRRLDDLKTVMPLIN